jgi:hypothetical protein
MKTSKRQALIDGFTSCGYEPVELRTRKYIGFLSPAGQSTYLIGKSAALRVIRTGDPISLSRSCTHSRFYRAVIRVGEQSECWSSPEQARAELRILLSSKAKLVESEENR